MGCTPVDAACSNGHMDIASLLRDYTLGTSAPSTGRTSSSTSGQVSASSVTTGSVQSLVCSAILPKTKFPCFIICFSTITHIRDGYKVTYSSTVNAHKQSS